MTAEKDHAGPYCTAEHLAALLQLSAPSIHKLRAQGAMVTETPDGQQKPRYHLERSLIAYARHLQERDKARDAGRRIKDAEADMREKKAAILSIDLRKRRSEVHDAAAVKDLINGTIVETAEAFMRVPEAVAGKIASCANAAEIAKVLRDAVCGVMRELSERKYDPDRLHEAASRIDTIAHL